MVNTNAVSSANKNVVAQSGIGSLLGSVSPDMLISLVSVFAGGSGGGSLIGSLLGGGSGSGSLIGNLLGGGCSSSRGSYGKASNQVNSGDSFLMKMLTGAGLTLFGTSIISVISGLINKGKNTAAVNAKTSELNEWTKQAGTQEGIKDFAIVGDDFSKDIKENGGKNAKEIYKRDVLALAKKDIAQRYDSDKDGNISPLEMVNREIFEIEEYTGKKLTDDEVAMVKDKALKRFQLMNLDSKKNNLFVSPEEYSAYLNAVDAENGKNEANGKMSREEIIRVEEKYIAPEHIDEAFATFKGKERTCFNSMFGYDPGAK